MNPFLDPHARLLVGHRGNSAHAPENTMESLRQAVELGVDAVEFDVRLSRDGVPMLMHDAVLDRTTNRSGPVSQYTVAELREVDAGARFGGRYAGAAVPTLEEVLATFRETPAIIEIKEPGAVDAVEAMIRRLQAAERVLIGSVNEAVMRRVYRTGLPSCAAVSDAAMVLPLALMGGTPSRGSYQVLSLTPRYHGMPVPVTLMAAAARRAGIPTHVWTVNDPSDAVRYWDAGVNAVLSDDPGAMIGQRSR